MRISPQFEKLHVSVLTVCYEFLADKDPETVRRGNLPNVTEVKRKKKKKATKMHILLFWLLISGCDSQHKNSGQL